MYRRDSKDLGKWNEANPELVSGECYHSDCTHLLKCWKYLWSCRGSYEDGRVAMLCMNKPKKRYNDLSSGGSSPSTVLRDEFPLLPSASDHLTVRKHIICEQSIGTPVGRQAGASCRWLQFCWCWTFPIAMPLCKAALVEGEDPQCCCRKASLSFFLVWR